MGDQLESKDCWARNSADGCRIHYRVVGDGPHTVLMLPGIGNSPHEFGELPQTLARHGYKCVLVDQRGTGKSDHPKRPWSMHTAANDVVAVMDELGVDRSDVIGYSYGGMVAQKVALTSPGRVQSLVLIATAGGMPYRHRSARGWKKRFGHKAGMDEPDVRRERLAIATYLRSPRLRHLNAPTLIIHGTADKTLPVSNGISLRARIPRSELRLVEGATHMIPHEASSQLAREIRRFHSRVELQQGLTT